MVRATKTRLLQRRRSRSAPNLPRCLPEIGLAVDGDTNKQKAQLNSRPEGAAKLQGAVSASKPPEHESGVRDLVLPIRHSHTNESGEWLGSNAVHGLAKLGVQPVAVDNRRQQLCLDRPRQGQRLADGAKATYRVELDLDARGARLGVNRRDRGAAELLMVPVTLAAAPAILGTLLSTLRGRGSVAFAQLHGRHLLNRGRPKSEASCGTKKSQNLTLGHICSEKISMVVRLSVSRGGGQ